MVSVRIAYVAVFAAVALASFGSLRAVGRLPDSETRRGLAGLLALSGLWSAAHVGRLVATDAAVKVGFYLFGLVVGLGTVGAWLYFCSAYTGHDYHRRPVLRRLAVGLFAVVVAVKLTNPLHNRYFTTTFATEPFPHLVIQQLAFHWVVTGLAYALSAVGFYMLYELFGESSYDTRALGGLVALTALPVALDLFGYASPGVVVELNYEPIGVALFALGVLYFVEEKFVAVPRFGRQQVIQHLDEPVLLLDRDGVLRDYNAAATAAFPALDGRLGDALRDIAPDLDASGDLLAVERAGTSRYYLRDETPLSVGTMDIGRALVYTDVTEVERQRRELRRQNEQLDDFADAITHELRNALAIVRGHLDLASDRVTADDDAALADSVTTAERTTRRMLRIVDDLALVARHGQTLDAVETCDVRRVARHAWGRTKTGGMTLAVEGDGDVVADESRFASLFAEAFEFARLTGATTVTVTVTPGAERIVVTTDGEPLSPEHTERAFEYGAAVPSGEVGMALPAIRTLARVHGWTTEVDPDYRDGVRIVIGDVTVTGA